MTAGASRMLLEQIQHAATSAGLDAVGVTNTAPFTQARRAIDERKAAGLHAGMWFTYGRPERATTPREHPDGRSQHRGVRSQLRTAESSHA